MPPKVSKLTSFLPTQKKAYTHEKLKESCDTEIIKPEIPISVTEKAIQSESLIEAPIISHEKTKNTLERPLLSPKRLRTSKTPVQLKTNEMDKLRQATLNQYILKTPQKKTLIPQETKTQEASVTNIQNIEQAVSDQGDQITETKTSSSQLDQSAEVKSTPAYIKYAHLLTEKPIHLRYEGDASTDKITPPKLISDGPRTFSTAFPSHKQLPAFLKYKHLTNLKEKKPLPKSFEILKQNFNALSNVIMFNKSKNQNIVFHKIQKSVEMISKHSFSILQLGQLKWLLGGRLICERVEIIHKGDRITSWQLDLLDSTNQSGNQSQSIWTSDLPFKAKNPTGATTGQSLEYILKDKLFNLVNESHQTFLNINNFKVDEDSNEWHPKFDLNTVKISIPTHPDICESIKPPPAKSLTNESPSEFQNLLNLAKSSSKSEVNMISEASKNLAGSVKDRKAALLEKIRAKKAKNQQNVENLPSGLNSKKLLMIDQILNLINSIYLTFQSINGRPLMLNHVADKLLSSPNCRLNQVEIIDHLRLLNELVPDFCQIESVVHSNSEIMKLDLSIDLKKVKHTLNHYKTNPQ